MFRLALVAIFVLAFVQFGTALAQETDTAPNPDLECLNGEGQPNAIYCVERHMGEFAPMVADDYTVQLVDEHIHPNQEDELMVDKSDAIWACGVTAAQEAIAMNANLDEILRLAADECYTPHAGPQESTTTSNGICDKVHVWHDTIGGGHNFMVDSRALSNEEYNSLAVTEHVEDLYGGWHWTFHPWWVYGLVYDPTYGDFNVSLIRYTIYVGLDNSTCVHEFRFS